MTTTPVGMRCPECAKQKTQVRTIPSLAGGAPTATYVLIALNVLAFFGSRSGGGETLIVSEGAYGVGQAYVDGALFAIGATASGLVGVADGEWYRMITAGFLHAEGGFGFAHIAMNMYALYWLGGLLEPRLGMARFLGLYFAAMLAGSCGALVISPDALTVGASGAVFGLMGAAFMYERARGMDPMQSGIGPVIIMNLAITFFPGTNISIGGHVGGLIGGVLVGLVIDKIPPRLNRTPWPAVVACVVVGALALGGGVVASQAERDKFQTSAAVSSPRG